ncbi:DNA sulfur modification protein DndE [Bacillus subtilis]|nr:DNA sulfur modification protein DndE [Bacillus subtilis]
MSNRLKISKKTSDKLAELQSYTNHTRNVLVRLAVGLSTREASMPDLPNDKAGGGFEIDRSVLTGDFDFAYKTLITQHAKREISDEEYFPILFNAHLERGIVLLENEYKHAGNNEKFQVNLLRYNEE